MPTRSFLGGAIATPHYLATLAGIETLNDGGNAVDAMVAANLALGVVAPYYCGYGGDLLAIVHDGTTHGYRSAGRSAAAASIAQMHHDGIDGMPIFGPHVVTVPGAVQGWFDLLERFGTRSFGALATRALQLASEGFILTKPGAFRLAASMAVLQSMGMDTRPMRANYPHVAMGDCVTQPELAATITALASDGPDAYYRGPIGAAIVETLHSLGSRMQARDLADHKAAWEQVLTAPFAGRTIVELPPPTQGVTALEMLRLADGSHAAADTTQRIHDQIEIAKAALWDRDAYVGDPASMSRTVEQLLSDAWIADRRRTLDPNRAQPIAPRPMPDGGTAYMCCADRDGLAISLIQSNFTAMGSGVHVPRWGINLHNRGASFNLDEGHVNALDGAKLPMHTLIPALVMKDKTLEYVFGTMGGHAQAQIHLQVLTRLLHDGDDPATAIAAPRFAVDPATAVVQVESRLDSATVEDLRCRGHVVNIVRDFDDAMGHCHTIRVTANGFEAAADPRAESLALGC